MSYVWSAQSVVDGKDREKRTGSGLEIRSKMHGSDRLSKHIALHARKVARKKTRPVLFLHQTNLNLLTRPSGLGQMSG